MPTPSSGYRYYVSHALLQNRSDEAGNVPRVSGPDVEGIVLGGLRQYVSADRASDPGSLADRELIDRYVERIIVKPSTIDVLLKEPSTLGLLEQQSEGDCAADSDGKGATPTVLTLPWSAPASSAIKGILHEPSPPHPMSPNTREPLLTAIGKARCWLDDLVNGRVASFAAIAKREGKVERHVRFLAPLAFISPRIIKAIIDGNAPSDLTVTALAKALPYSWAEQERRLRFSLG